MAWLRQYQYNLHSPLQPPVVKALLLVLRSSAALALAAVAPLGVAQFIRMRTARSPRRGSQPVCKSTACRLLTPLRLRPFKTFADCCCKKKAAPAAPFTHKPQGVACRGVQPRKCRTIHPPCAVIFRSYPTPFCSNSGARSCFAKHRQGSILRYVTAAAAAARREIARNLSKKNCQ